jgi:hypothetical protein
MDCYHRRPHWENAATLDSRFNVDEHISMIDMMVGSDEVTCVSNLPSTASVWGFS